MSRANARLWAVLAAILLLALAVLAVRGFVAGRSEAAREAEGERAVVAPPRVSRENGRPVVTLDPATQRNGGIETAVLKNGPHQVRLRAYGVVLDLRPMLELANRYAEAKAKLEIARAKLAATQTAFERAQKLFKDQQNMSAAQLQAAEAAFRIDQAGLAAAEAQRRSLAATVQQDWGPVLGGAIVDDAPLFERLAARQDLLLQVSLRPDQPVAGPPQDASVRLDNGRSVPLRFVSAATRTDPRQQGASFFFTVAEDSGLLPGMSVVAGLAAGPPVEGAVVPRAAIVWEQGRAWAYFRVGPKAFARRAVATTLPAPEGGYIVQGIPEDAELVIAGAQTLLSEEFRARIQSGDED